MYTTKSILINSGQTVKLLKKRVRVQIYKAILRAFERTLIEELEANFTLQYKHYSVPFELKEGLCVALTSIASSIYNLNICYNNATLLFPELKDYKSEISAYWFSNNDERIEALQEMAGIKINNNIK